MVATKLVKTRASHRLQLGFLI